MIYTPLPNLALIDCGATCLASAESVGPNNSLQAEITPAPIISNAITGPLVTKFNKLLQQKNTEPLLICVELDGSKCNKILYEFSRIYLCSRKRGQLLFV